MNTPWTVIESIFSAQKLYIVQIHPLIVSCVLVQQVREPQHVLHCGDHGHALSHRQPNWPKIDGGETGQDYDSLGKRRKQSIKWETLLGKPNTQTYASSSTSHNPVQVTEAKTKIFCKNSKCQGQNPTKTSLLPPVTRTWLIKYEVQNPNQFSQLLNLSPSILKLFMRR